MRSFIGVVAVLMMLLGSAGCSSLNGFNGCGSDFHGSSPSVRTELFFGLSRIGAPQLSDTEWEQFVRKYVVPAFPKGFTVMNGSGYWVSVTGNKQWERSRVVVIVHDDTEKENAALEYLRSIYQQLFGQEAVLRVDSCAQMDF